MSPELAVDLVGWMAVGAVCVIGVKIAWRAARLSLAKDDGGYDPDPLITWEEWRAMHELQVRARKRADRLARLRRRRGVSRPAGRRLG